MLIGVYPVPGFQVGDVGFDGRVSASIESPSDDLSGNTDSTDRAEKGIKPKKLNVSFSLQKTEWLRLAALVELAEARQSEEAVPYMVVHPLAMALRIRQAKFSGVNIEEDDVLHCWHVSFTLAEHRSVPETAAARNGSGNAPKESFDALVKRMESV